MKKILLFVCITISSLAFGQLTLIDPVELATGDVNNPDDNLLAVHWDIRNDGESTSRVRVSREILIQIEGTRERFCWGPLCYAWGAESSLEGPGFLVQMNPGEVNTTFVGDYEHNGFEGSSLIRYVFFDNQDNSISTAYDVTYCVGTDPAACVVNVEEIPVDNYIGNITPNPIRTKANLNYQIDGYGSDSKLIVHNMIGEVMLEQRIGEPSGSLQLDLSEIPNGIYFYSIVNGNTPIGTKKLVVSK